MGRQAQGVRLIHLQGGDRVVSAVSAEPGITILTVTEKGFSKRTPIEEYRLQSRGGKGVRTMRLNEKTGKIADALAVRAEDEMVLVTNTGRIIRLDIEDISERKRTTQGVRAVRLEEEEVVTRIARVIEEET
jgi:DNA gyrase subunit A